MNMVAYPDPLKMTIYQQPGDLILGIFDRPLTTEPLTLEQTTIQQGPVSARFQIIGESHIARLERGGLAWFSETLSCLPLRAPDCLHWHSFIERRDHHFRQDHYEIKVHFQDKVIPARRTTGQSSIQVHFPPVFGQVPVTRIEWQIGVDTLKWWTLHTYPEAMHTTYVESESVVRW